jgi:hypothetical protein
MFGIMAFTLTIAITSLAFLIVAFVAEVTTRLIDLFSLYPRVYQWVKRMLGIHSQSREFAGNMSDDKL